MMSSSLVDTSNFAPHHAEEMTKAFLFKHHQLVETVLRESCANAIEAITRQTYSLMSQDDVAGCLGRATEPKLVSEPKLLSKPMPSVLGVQKGSILSSSSPSGMESDLLTPLFVSPNAPANLNSARPLSILADLEGGQAESNCNPGMDSHLFTATRISRSEMEQKKKIPLAHERRSKVRSTMRKSFGGDFPHLQRGLFADGEAMKEKLRLAITQPVYDVASFYSKTGYCQAVARSALFDNTTLFVIALNAIWIAIDVDLNDADVITNAHTVFQVADNFFCAYFLLELIIRFLAFAHKRNALKDAWFVFDSCMLVLMLFDTWFLPLMIFCFKGTDNENQKLGDTAVLKGLRLARLIRMARMLRLLHAVPELIFVIKGLFVATRAVSCTVILMLLIIYVFAITFRQMTSGTELGNTHFHSIPATMRYLLVLGTMPDLYDYVLVIWNEGVVFALMFLFFVLIVTITVMNMLVGVLVGVVNTVASVEKEQLMVSFVKDNLLALLKVMHHEDSNEDQHISKEEFCRLIQNTDAIRCFTAMGVDVVGLVDLADFIFQGGQLLAFADFMDLILQLRGSNQATVKDIVDLRRFITMEFNAVLQALDLIPHNTLATELVSKGIEKSADFRRQRTRDLASISESMGPYAASQQDAGSSELEAGVLEPFVEASKKSNDACSEAAVEHVRKKKIKKRTASLKPNTSSDSLFYE